LADTAAEPFKIFGMPDSLLHVYNSEPFFEAVRGPQLGGGKIRERCNKGFVTDGLEDITHLAICKIIRTCKAHVGSVIEVLMTVGINLKT
jgi:hypothetical protein